jgi:hypothetical protein
VSYLCSPDKVSWPVCGDDPVDINKRKEEFSLAYVRAVAAAAGCGTKTPTPDDHSVDIELIKLSTGDDDDIRVTDPQLGIQAKCTSQDILSNGIFRFPLPIKNYEDLRKIKLSVPRILVVHTVPAEPEDWLLHSEEEMRLRRCSYWISLKGLPNTTNSDSVTVHIPKTNVFNPVTLLAMMERIEKGEAI